MHSIATAAVHDTARKVYAACSFTLYTQLGARQHCVTCMHCIVTRFGTPTHLKWNTYYKASYENNATDRTLNKRIFCFIIAFSLVFDISRNYRGPINIYNLGTSPGLQTHLSEKNS